MQASVRAWRDTIEVLGALATPASIVLAISIAFAFLQHFIAPAEKALQSGPLLASFIIICGQAFLLTPYLIAIHRFIILGEATTRYEITASTHRFQLFFLWSMALSMFYWVPAFLIAAFFAKTDVLFLMATLLLLAFTIAALIITVRLIILFPAIAVDAPGATWANAMAHTKGNVWRILFISMVAALPAFAGMTVLLLIVPKTWPLVSAILEGAMSVLLMTLAIAIASRLYEQLGDRVNRKD
ncbi:MAG: hypothetical protein QOG38_834 [Hyphomicrobiales bacterium]|nr:hypothetical protein [Hyphomicrobiales bacterium]